jgi:hypothetical protein
MGELWIALGIVASLGALAATYLVPPVTLLLIGFWVTLGGLVFGLPTGALYHVLLYRSLAACGRLPERWWLSPTSLHGALPAEDRASVLAWCYAGAAGCFACFVGCALVALAAWRGL